MTVQHRDFTHGAAVLAPVIDRVAPARMSPRVGFYRNYFKRFLDVALVLISLPVVLPVIAILCAVIFLRDGANPIYRQARVGKDGAIFNLWKLRTMVPDADDRLRHHLASDADAKRQWDEKQKLIDDPRITRFGQILRKSSMDELPQLFNVLFGDMSLVGPRPMMPEQRSLYPGAAYTALRPGLTGYWQISDRNACSFAQRAKFDTRYHDDVSLPTDVTVLAKTVGVVLRGTGC